MTRQKTILIADDDATIRTVVSQALMRAGFDIRTTATAAGLWQFVEHGEGDVVLTDVVMPDENGLDLIPRILKLRPDLPVIVMSAQNTLATAVKASEAGAYDYLPKPFDLKVLLRTIESASQKKPDRAAPFPSEGDDGIPLIGRSSAMQDVYRIIARVVNTDLTVMITGESGTGKELVARALHDLGKRKDGPFVAVNMAAIPKELIESDLFGHERGAFTGALSRGLGKFEQAQGGTLFLDEIGDMPIDAQTRLLRVLQEGEFTSVGGRRAVKTDVRVIAATNKNAKNLVEQGLLREDLFFRLNVIPIRLPALRERIDDISSLADHFLKQAERAGLPRKFVDPGALEQLERYRWPGNVRELENLMRRLAALHSQDTIDGAAIASELAEANTLESADPENGSSLGMAVEYHIAKYFMAHGRELPPDGVYDRVLREIERPVILACLAATNGNQLKAAQLLGLNRNTLRKKMRLLDISTGKGFE